MNKVCRFLLILFTFFAASLSAQERRVITNYPYVASYYPSYAKIVSVGLYDNATMFILKYESSSSGWIAIASDTHLYDSNGKKLTSIEKWAIFDDDDEPHYLSLDTKYSVKKGETYTLGFVFGKIPSGITKVTIREYGETNPFYWKGIEINNPAEGASTGRSDGGFKKNKGGNSGGSSESGSYTRPWTETPAAEERFSPTGSGTCFAVGRDGVVATCYHVVEGATKFRIRGIGENSSKRYKAKVIYRDQSKDLALLKIEDDSFSGFGTIPYSIDESLLATGESIYVLGYPLLPLMGDEIKLTTGIISSRSGFQGDQTAYQISASVQPGNSGGPLLSDGKVVGVVNARLYVENAAYAVKAEYLKSALVSNGVTPKTSSSLVGKSLPDQVAAITPFVFIIETE